MKSYHFIIILIFFLLISCKKKDKYKLEFERIGNNGSVQDYSQALINDFKGEAKLLILDSSYFLAYKISFKTDTSVNKKFDKLFKADSTFIGNIDTIKPYRNSGLLSSLGIKSYDPEVAQALRDKTYPYQITYPNFSSRSPIFSLNLRFKLLDSDGYSLFEQINLRNNYFVKLNLENFIEGRILLTNEKDRNIGKDIYQKLNSIRINLIFNPAVSVEDLKDNK